MQPGRLTTLHLRGVSARFASPFGLYLLLSPSFAAVVALFNHDRSIGFAGHLAFSLHLHAFCFLIAALTLLLPVNPMFAAHLVTLGALAAATLRR